MRRGTSILRHEIRGRWVFRAMQGKAFEAQGECLPASLARTHIEINAKTNCRLRNMLSQTLACAKHSFTGTSPGGFSEICDRRLPASFDAGPSRCRVILGELRITPPQGEAGCWPISFSSTTLQVRKRSLPAPDWRCQTTHFNYCAGKFPNAVDGGSAIRALQNQGS